MPKKLLLENFHPAKFSIKRLPVDFGVFIADAIVNRKRKRINAPQKKITAIVF